MPRPRIARSGWRGVAPPLTIAAALTVVVVAVVAVVALGLEPAPRPAVPDPAAPDPAVPAAPAPVPGAAPGPAAAGPGAGPPSGTAAPEPAAPGPATVLVRSVGDLPAEVVPRVTSLRGLAAVAVVRSGTAYLTASHDARGRPMDAPSPGWGLPMDIAGIDPEAYAALLPADQRAQITGLRRGQALLGSTSARLRRLGPGAVLTFGGRRGGVRLRVVGAVDDALVGGAELVVRAADAAKLGVEGASYVLAGAADTAGADTADADAADADAAGGSAVGLRVGKRIAGVPGVLARSLGRAPWPVSWREVLPQALVKDRFGELPLRLARGRAVQLDPAWVRDHIVTGRVPLLGEVRCHRAMLPALRAALAELEREGLGRLVDPADYAGCFSPRLIAAGAPVSRHAWGIAVDLNASRNPNGAPSRQDPRLVEIMERHGFAFGGRWPIPDPMHFEYRGR